MRIQRTQSWPVNTTRHVQSMQNNFTTGNLSSVSEIQKDLKLEFQWKSLLLPCFGFPLKTSVKHVAIINLVAAIIIIVVLSVSIMDRPRLYNELEDVKQYCLIAFWAIYYLYLVTDLYLSKLLYQSSLPTEYHKCKQWLWVQTIAYVIFLPCFLLHIFWVKAYAFETVALLSTYAVYKMYTFWAVYALKRDKDSEIAMRQIHENLPEGIVEDFTTGSTNNTDMYFTNLPYNKSKLEIDPSRISGLRKLESGNQADVFRGVYQNPAGNGVEVAVKTVRRAGQIYFTAQMKDLKIRQLIGDHENVVKLIGACTASMRNLEIHIVMEMCHLGSVKSFLEPRAGIFDNQVDCHGNLQVSQTSGPEFVSTMDLISWALDAANGLNYIHSKKIIHNDVAARNILISKNRVAKLTDFGYSVPMGHAGVGKSRQTSFPILWMAPETLSDLSRKRATQLTAMSDVWSYGVTLLEMFTLCEQPAVQREPSESQQYDIGRYHRQLYTGVLPRPEYAPSEIYEVMKRCWMKSCLDRCSLDQIILELKSIKGRAIACVSESAQATDNPQAGRLAPYTAWVPRPEASFVLCDIPHTSASQSQWLQLSTQIRTHT